MQAIHLTNSPGITGLCLNGKHLYAIGFGTLTIYDITDCLNPKPLGQLCGLGGGRQLALMDNMLLVTARERGLWVIDITAPEKPAILQRIDTVELATGIATEGRMAFVAQRLYGIETLEFLPDGSCIHHATFPTDEAQSVVAKGNRCFVGDWRSGKITVLKNAPDGSLSYEGHASLDGFGDGLCLVDNGSRNEMFIYAATGHHSQTISAPDGIGAGHGIEIFRMSPESPTPQLLSRLKFPCWPHTLNDYWTVRGDEFTAFVADTHNGLFQVDVRDKQHPVITDRLILPVRNFGKEADGTPRSYADCVSSIAVSPDTVYAAGSQTGLWIIPRTDAGSQNHRTSVENAAAKSIFLPTDLQVHPSENTVQRNFNGYFVLQTGTQFRQAIVTGNRIYAAASHAGLLEITNCGSEWKISKTLTKSCVYDIARHGSRLFVAEDLDYLAIYQIQPDGSASMVVRYRHNGHPILHVHISSDGHYAFITGGTIHTTILDITDSQNIHPVFSFICGQLQYGDFFPEHDIDGIIPNNWHWGGIAWYDISCNPPALLRHDKERFADQTDGFCIYKNQFLAAAWGKGYLLGDANHFTLYQAEGDQPAGVPAWNGKNTVVFSSRRTGIVQFFDFSSPTHARFIPELTIETHETPGRVSFLPTGQTVIPAGHAGLLIKNR